MDAQMPANSHWNIIVQAVNIICGQIIFAIKPYLLVACESVFASPNILMCTFPYSLQINLLYKKIFLPTYALSVVIDGESAFAFACFALGGAAALVAVRWTLWNIASRLIAVIETTPALRWNAMCVCLLHESTYCHIFHCLEHMRLHICCIPWDQHRRNIPCSC